MTIEMFKLNVFYAFVFCTNCETYKYNNNDKLTAKY